LNNSAARVSDIEPGPEKQPAPSAGPALTCVRLTNFRSYAAAELHVDAAPVALFGANGIGKTNLLEAISLLSPGRGLRGAHLADIQRKAPTTADALWAATATLARGPDTHEIGTGLAATDGAANAFGRRLTRLNGAAALSADMAELLPMLWLTPAMDRLFLEDSTGRRRFLDRLVFGLDAGHARRAARYEAARRERSRLLRDGRNDPSWLDGLEEAMAETGAAMTEARLSTIERLNAELTTRGEAGAFPCAHLSLEDHLRLADAVDLAKLRTAFAAARTRDAESGHTTVGPHRSDLGVRHTGKRADARDCSTGEQKALLVSIVLANAWLQRARNDAPPVLLLDEIAAHLDAARREALFDEVLALGSQTWMTGTDRDLFAPVEGRAQFVTIANGQFVRTEGAP
jgi:DNA replication and repair protein RecF